MYKLLLVDDEFDVIEAIKNLIDWSQYNINVIGTCLNGVEALKLIEQQQPDIVIIDIKMPVITGIDLIRLVKSKGIDVEFIVLSGYNEFQFAKDAMKEGVKHYLLKPCSEVEIEDALKKAISDISNRHLLKQNVDKLEVMENALINQYVMLALQNEQMNKEISSSIKTILGSEKSIFWVSYHYRQNIEDPKRVFQCFKKICENNNIKLICPVLVINGVLGGIYTCRLGKFLTNVLTYQQKMLADILCEFPQINIVKKLNPDNLYNDMVKSCGKYGGYTIITDKGQKYEKIRNFNNDDMFCILKDLDEAIVQDDIEKLRNIIINLFKFYDRNFSVLICTKFIIKNSINSNMDLSNLIQMFNKIYETNNIDDIANFICQNLKKPKQEGYKENFINDILKYVDENLDDDRLNLKWIANKVVFMNEDYVGKVFLRETGENFTSYLNKKRIEKAKFIMGVIRGDKIYEVAEQVGFGKNHGYFSKVFKKYTGYTPTKYKLLIDKQNQS